MGRPDGHRRVARFVGASSTGQKLSTAVCPRLSSGDDWIQPQNRSVDGSIPPLATINRFSFTDLESASFNARFRVRGVGCPRNCPRQRLNHPRRLQIPFAPDVVVEDALPSLAVARLTKSTGLSISLTTTT